DEYVTRPELTLDIVRQLFDVAELRDVSGKCQRLASGRAADRGRRFLTAVFRTTRQRDRGASFRQRGCHRLAEPTGASGHQRDFPIETKSIEHSLVGH